ncbi:sdad1 protein [Lentinula edodes]|uniref:Sdad1 protein n=1 Tax=Lentinula edodes TaxID=5353 RepID=A0A1Q3E405_LENED|nr:sdad1 protein [Lentinula edodes]
MENSLHLDLNSLTLDSSKNAESTVPATSVEDVSSTQSESPDSSEKPSDKSPEVAVPESRERKKPYVNPERVNTGGSQRDKLSEEELTERMERIRQQNEKIKQRRVDVQADEDAFRKTQQNERAKMARIRKVQESVNNTREQNAKRKMDKIQSREWDSAPPMNHKKLTVLLCHRVSGREEEVLVEAQSEVEGEEEVQEGEEDQ